jgi:16S rRNA (guanine966-N2)-methyltransferase
MRVVAGQYRGRILAAPTGVGTRPTSDKVRQATFNALESMGALDEARVLDLFAGSGALGIEALSRGAAHCTFVEKDASALAVLKANVGALKIVDATVLAADVMRSDLLGRLSIDLVLCDPPYVFDEWLDLASRLPGEVLAAESNRTIDLGPSWETVREKTYGGTVVTLARRAGSVGSAESAEQ